MLLLKLEVAKNDMKVKSYVSEKDSDLFVILPADKTPQNLPPEITLRLGSLTLFNEIELSSTQPRLGINTQVALEEILAKGYYLAKLKMKFIVTQTGIVPKERIMRREMKLPESRKLTMITGAGTSISFGLPSTSGFTELIAASLHRDHRMAEEASALALYNAIDGSLRNYLVNPGNVTFEDIYQSIQDVRTIQGIPHDRRAFDAFRPRVGATHVLGNQFTSYSDWDGMILQNAYLDNILDTFLNALDSVRRTDLLSAALNYIVKKFLVWSFTLNYDNIVSDVLNGFTSGFVPGNAPRAFRPAILLSALESNQTIHSHLHGALKLGFPLGEPLNMFELHEFDNPGDGVRRSKSRPSGRPIQRGETLSPSPIITGLDKTELVFKQPFFTNFLAFFRALDLCTDLLIAGYGFTDRHVNIGIEQCRQHHPNVTTYIVDQDDTDDPSSYFERLTLDARRALSPGEATEAVRVPGFPGWWQVPGCSSGEIITGPIFLWLRGFDTFCEAVVNDEFPE